MPERWRVPALVVLVVAAGLALALPLGAARLDALFSGQDQVRSWVSRAGAWGPVVVVALQVLQVLIAPLPGQVIGAASGYLYGPWLGTLYSMAGQVAGSVLVFGLARRFGRPLAERLVGTEDLARLDDRARRGGALLFFLIWLLPLLPDDVACVAAGLTPLSFSRFLVLLVVGRLPGTALASWVGARLVEPNPVWLAAGLAAIALGAVVVWRWGGSIQAVALTAVERLARWLRGSRQ